MTIGADSQVEAMAAGIPTTTTTTKVEKASQRAKVRVRPRKAKAKEVRIATMTVAEASWLWCREHQMGGSYVSHGTIQEQGAQGIAAWCTVAGCADASLQITP